jgi:hypothetical protein
MLYHLADWFFLILHSLLVLFNLFGWMRKAWLKANLVTLLLTAGSWVFLGYFYGWGYCPLTDWHWQVLENIGKTPQTPSYIAYLFSRLLATNVSDFFADALTLSTFLVALVISIVLNTRAVDRKRNMKTGITKAP